MRAGLRLGLAILAAVLAFGQAPSLAQSTNSATTNTPAPETIGPRELQNFSLPGTTTKPSEEPAPAPPPSTRALALRPERTVTAPPTERRPPPVRSVQLQPQSPRTVEPTVSSPQRRAPLPVPASSTQTLALPPATAAPALPADEPALPPATGGGPPMLVWLLLAVAIGGGAALLLWRRRSRAAFAGGPEFDLFSAPEPAPQPAPTPTPLPPVPVQPMPRTEMPPAEPSKPVGVVSSRLRPWIDLNFSPLACDIEPERLVLHFDLEMFNSGSAVARDLLVEASLFNPGPTQEQDIAAFFAKPPGPGERIPGLAPLKRISIRNSIIAERANIQTVELAGKQVYVPVVGFNVYYRGSVGGAQTSASYLVGRETGREKLGPVALGSKPRQIAGLGVRPLPIAVRE